MRPDDHEPPAHTPEPPRRPVETTTRARRRTFYAADGGPVTVREVDAPDEPWAHAARCLLFEREGVIRRVWDYPAEWADLPDAGLEALSWRR